MLTTRVCFPKDLHRILAKRIINDISSYEQSLLCIESTYVRGTNPEVLYQALVLTQYNILYEATDARGGGTGRTRKLSDLLEVAIDSTPDFFRAKFYFANEELSTPLTFEFATEDKLNLFVNELKKIVSPKITRRK